MRFTEEMKHKVLRGEWIDRQEALRLSKEPLVVLAKAADEIRKAV